MAGRIAASVLAAACLLLAGPLRAQGGGSGSQTGPREFAAATEQQRLEQRIAELERALASYQESTREQEQLSERVEELERALSGREDTTAQQEQLEERVEELETAKVAHEDATRAIIADSFSQWGSKVNEFVTLGGTLEVLTGWEQDFRGESSQEIILNTAELDFEIQVNDWVMGSLILEYNDGRDRLFPTTDGDEAGVDRINIDTAFITVGDPERFWPIGMFGRMVLPFGISTGDPVADVLTLNDPLTVEVFETRRDAVLFGAQFPTRPLAPLTPVPDPPPIQPALFKPLVGKLSRSLGYKPLPKPPPSRGFSTPVPEPPPFSAGIYLFQGDTYERLSRKDELSADGHWGATLGYRTSGNCRSSLASGASEDLGWLHTFCPWTLDIDVDYNHSVFDSEFLSFEYRNLLGQIGFVPGMAASLKANLGPVGFVAEWNGAIDDATFTDDLGRNHMRPGTWQVSLGYQFDWKPWVTVIGAQGTYVAIGYSESRDLEGVLLGGERIGFVPKRRILVSVGEWVADGLRLAFEYSYIQDYRKGAGGTGRHANGVFSMLTYEW
ncbi:MAG: hypothetical protein ABFS46_13775 [Myxococcota bacterium]